MHDAKQADGNGIDSHAIDQLTESVGGQCGRHRFDDQ